MPQSGVWRKVAPVSRDRGVAARAQPPAIGRSQELPHPLIPADAGIQTLPNGMDFQWGKGWIPASAGMSGGEAGGFRQFPSQALLAVHGFDHHGNYSPI
jgi:hypothetical protein